MSGERRPRVFDIGYEGRDLEEFIAILKANGVVLLCDVRERPQSRKPGFSKTPLSEALAAAGIEYSGMKEIGCPPGIRYRFRGAEIDKEAFWAEYEEHLGTQGPDYAALVALARERSTAIMCLERDFLDCHRAVIVRWLERDGFRCAHL